MRMSGVQIVVITVAGFFSALFLWSSQFKVDQVVRAEAKVVPVKDVVKVQNRFPGAVDDVFVSLGDEVSAGDLLFRIDPEDTEIDLTQTLEALYLVQARVARLKAQISGGDLVYDSALPPQVIEAQKSILLSKRSELVARASLVESEIRALEIAIEEAQTTAEAASRQSLLVQQEIDILTPLVKAGAESKIRLIQSKRTLNDLLERESVSALRARRYAADLQSKRRTIEQDSERYLLEAREQLAESQAEYSRLRSEVDRAGERRSRSEVLAPIDGIVTALPFAVVGQIAESGTVLAELVPSDTSYKVEAQIRSADISYVQVDQKARLSLVAYDFADYGHIDVVVKKLAQNLTEPQQAEPFYKAEFAIDNLVFSKTGKPVRLMPGLIGQIDVLGEPITILDYVTKPVARLSSRALTER